MEGDREHLSLDDSGLSPQIAQKTNQEGVRKSSRQRKQSKKAFSMSNWNNAPEGLQHPVKTVVKKRRQQLNVCGLCQKFLLKKDRHIKKNGTTINDGATDLKAAADALKNICTKCATIIERQKKAKKPTKADREKFEAEGVSFGEDLGELLKDQEAKRLYCPFYQVHPCGCVQKYISGDLWKQKKIKQKTAPDGTVDLEAPGESADPKDRGLFLLSLRKESLRKRREIVDARRLKNKAERDLMFPEEFTQFLLSRRLVLRRAGLCERGCQRVLGYSNNFLHKKVMNGPRLQPSKGRAVGVLIKLEDLPSKTCCSKKCVKMAEINLDLLSKWRHQAAGSQKLSQQVIMDMFTPDEKKHVNCPTFVGMVTGSCKSKIMKIKTNMILAGDNKQDLEREKGKVQLIRENPDYSGNAKQSRISTGADNSETVLGSSLTHGKTSSPLHVSAPLIRNPMKCVTPQPSVEQPSPFKLLEDRHKREMEELKRKQQEELECFEQLQHSQRKEQQDIVLGQAKFDQNLVQAQTPVNFWNADVLPLIASSKQNFTSLADFKVPASTQAFNFAAVNLPVASGHCLNISSPFSGTQMGTSESCSVTEVMDKNRKPLTSKALPFFLAKPSSLASGTSFQQSFSLPPSTLLSPSSLGAPTVLVLGSETVASTPRLPATSFCKSKDTTSNASSSRAGSSFGTPELLGHLAVTDQMSLSSQTPQITQSKTITADTPLQTSVNHYVHIPESGHRGNSLPAVNLLVGRNVFSQSAQDLHGHTLANSLSHLPGGTNDVSRTKQSVALTRDVSPAPYQCTLVSQNESSQFAQTESDSVFILSKNAGCASCTSGNYVTHDKTLPGPKLHALREILPASDLQSIEGNTLTYSTVSLTRDTVVSSSSPKGQIGSNVSIDNAKGRSVNLENNKVSKHEPVDLATSVPSSLPIVNDEQHSLTPKSYLLSDNGQIYCILQGESQWLERQQTKCTTSTVSTSIYQSVSQPTSAMSSSFSKMHFTSPLPGDSTMLKVNVPSASSHYHASMLKPTVHSHNAVLNNEGDKKEQQFEKTKSISVSSPAQISGEGTNHFAIKLGHQKNRTNHDKSQPVVGVVHPHVTQSKSEPAQEEMGSSQETITSTPSRSLGNGQSHIVPLITTEQSQGAARQTNPITLPHGCIVPLQSSTSSVLSLESPILSQPFSNHFSCVLSHGSQSRQQMDPNHRHQIMPLHEQQTNFNQSIPLRPRGIALPQKLTFSEKQLQFIPGTHNIPPRQSLMQTRHNAVPQEFLVGEQLQQLQQAQLAQTCHSLQPTMHEVIKQKSEVEVANQLAEPQQAGVQTEGYHILTGGQSMENIMLSSSSVLHTESNNLQDLQPTIQLLSGSTHNDGVTQVLMPSQSNLSNPLASSEPQLRTELREALTEKDYYSSVNQQIVPNSSTTVQTIRTEIPLIVSLSSTTNNHSITTELTENNPSESILKDNVERYGSNQIQHVGMIRDRNAVLMATTDGQTYQSLSMSDNAKENTLIKISTPKYSKSETEECLNIKGNIFKPSSILESSKDTLQSPLVNCNSLMPLHNADNFNTTVSIDLEQNGPSNSTNSNYTLLPFPIQQSVETVPTSQIAVDGKMPMTLNQQISEGRVCIQMPSHEVPVIQHTLDQKKVVVLAGNDNSGFPMPLTSTPGNQQIIINFPFQDSRSTSPFVAPLKSSSVVVPILDEQNGPQLIYSEPSSLIQGTETQCKLKLVGSLQKNQELQNLVTADAQNVQHILPNVHHEESNAPTEVTYPVEISSRNYQSSNAHYSIPSFQTSQYSQTSKQLFSKAKGEQHHNYTQRNQVTCNGRKVTSNGGSEESASSASKLGSVSRGTKSTPKPKGNTVILVPDKPGFPRYQVTQLSPDPDNQNFFSESSETAPGSFSIVATPPTTHINACLPPNETILQMIAQSLMSQNLTLTNGTQIILPFQEGISESSASVMAKYEVRSRQENTSMNPSQMTLRDNSMQEERKTFSSISDKLHQHQANLESCISSHEGSLNKVAVKTMIHTGAGSSESSMIRQVYGKLGDEQPAGNSTHIIGDSKIGSLVKAIDDNKTSDSTTEKVKSVMEMLKDNNTSSSKINLPEVNSQASLTFLKKSGMNCQPMLMVPIDGFKNHSSNIQEENVRLNVSSPHRYLEKYPNALSGVMVANVKTTKISKPPSVIPPSKNPDISNNKIPAQELSEQSMQQLSFLHDKELVIDITNDNTRPSQGQEHGKTKAQPAAFQVQVKSSTENQMALDISSFLPSYELKDKKCELMTIPERICVPPLVDSSSPNVSSFATLLENPETCATLIRLLKNTSELQNQSSVILSTHNLHDEPHSNDSCDTTFRVECKRERPCSLSQTHLNDISRKGEIQARRRTGSIGTPGTKGSSKKSHIHSYSTTSLPSSAVTFTRDTATTHESAGPPNVTLVSPTSLKRKHLQELENAAALSQNQNQQTERLLIVTPSQLPNEENQRDAQHFSLPVSHPCGSSTHTVSVVDVSNSLVVSKTNTTYNTDIMSTTGKSNTSFACQTLNTVNKRNSDTQNNESLFMASSPGCASQQNKLAGKRSVIKPRKHSKPPTIRDILSFKESSKVQTLAVSMPLEEMQYIIPVPVSGNVKFMSSNTQILSTEENKNASHTGLAFDVEGKSTKELSLPGISSRVKLRTGTSNYKCNHLQSEGQEKIHTAPESARRNITAQTGDGKTLRTSNNRNISTSRVCSTTKCKECWREFSTELDCPHGGPSINEINSKNSFNPVHDLNSVYESTSDDQTMKIDGHPCEVKKNVDLLSIALTKSTSKGRLTQSESLSINEATRAGNGIRQICNSKVITSVTHSCKPISHHTSLSAGTKTLNTMPPKNSLLSELIAKHPDQLIGCTNQQQYSMTSKNPEEDIARSSLVPALNIMENEKESSVKVFREDGHINRWRHLDEDTKMKSTPYGERPDLVSSNIQHCLVNVKDNSANHNQPQKISFHLVNVSPSTELSCLDTGAFFDPKESITGRIVAPPLVSSVTNQSLWSDLAEPLNSSQSLLETTSHNISNYGDKLNVKSQFRTEPLISSSLQMSTPLLTHMLQSSPAPLRSGAHKDEKNTSMMWEDASTDKGDKQPCIQRSSCGKYDEKCSVEVFDTSVIPNTVNSLSASMHGKTFHQAYTETFSASCTEFPKVTMSDRITQVIDNMYKRHDDVLVYASAEQPQSGMSQAGDMIQSCTTDKKQLNNNQRCGTHEYDTHSTMLKKRKSRKRTISENSGPEVAQGSLKCVHNSDHPCKYMQCINLSLSESKSGKRSKSKKEGSSRDRRKGSKSGHPGHCLPKRVKFSDTVIKEDPYGETIDDKSSLSNIRGAAPIMPPSVTTSLKDNILSSSNLQPKYSQDDSNTLFKSSCVNDKEPNVSTNFTPSSHGMIMHQNILPDDQSSSLLPQKDHYPLEIDLQQGNDNSDGMNSSFWSQQPSEDPTRRETMTDILRHYHRPLSLPRNLEPRKDTGGIVSHSLKNNAKPMKIMRSATESLTVSPGQSYSANHTAPEHSIAEGEEGMERGYQVPWAYSGEHESSFEIISPHGYSKLSQKLKRQDPSTTISSTEHKDCLLPSSSTTQISSSKGTDYIESPWQESENADVDISKLHNAMDPSVKRQKALQSDFKLAQQMAHHPSQARSRHPSQEVNDQSLDSGSSYMAPSALTESSLHELYENSCMRSLYTAFQENVRLKHAVALATENHSRQRNLSAADKQKNVACSSEIDFLRRNSSMPSSPFEPDNIRKSPRAMILGKYGSALSLQSSHGRHPSSQESRSRNASGSHGLSQHYGESDVPLAKLMEVDAGIGDSFHTHLNYNCFVPLSNQDVALDIDPIPGQIDSLRLRNYQDNESDVHNRHRNLSSSSIKSALIDSVIELEHGSRSRNPSASSLLRYFDHGNIRSRNPSGSSSRRSRPGSCSSDREFPEMDMLSLLRNSPFNQAWFS